MHLRLTFLASQVLLILQAGATEPATLEGYLPVMQAHQYQDGLNVHEYWQSEKLDGIRAVWDGTKLFTRNGRQIHAPAWFIEPLPDYPVEGELWAGRGNFHLVQQTVLDHKPIDQSWQQIDFMLFDMPHAAGDYQKRYYNIVHYVTSVDHSHIKYIEHTPITSEKELFQYLDNVNNDKGEGVMLRKITSRYQAGRSSDLLKLKTHQDDEAQVIGYKVGRGQYKGMMGSILVKWQDGVEFYIGSGFSEQQRKNPPPIGSTITFRYNGLTQNGVPKFARYVRERVE
ncbi:DNA ligase [Vibrio sp. LaRot3]|uniref:DNA ligase n=1 Tax=Vibrio sp. LaRot3 TaxID=2998829 RepID=UPI0022CE05CD|nr:DNA ligase [Vibrio sp. LaRot3]MDA0147600.1 DNA ligase [Vibrio sp. LaRot3]